MPNRKILKKHQNLCFQKKITFAKIIFKMKKSVQILSFIFSLLIIFSCEPSRAENGDLLNGVKEPEIEIDEGTSTPTKLLKKVTIDDEGDITTYTYIYDGSKRLVNVNSSDNNISIVITYDTDSKIKKIVRKTNSGGSQTTEEISPVYTDKRITKIEKIYTEGESIKTVANVTYNTTGLASSIKENVYDDTNTNIIATFNSTFSYSGDNIIKWNYKANLDFGFPIPIFDFLKDIELTMDLSDYDKKINPYNLLPKDYLIATAHSEVDASSITGFAKNNFRKAHAKISFGSSTPVEDSQTVAYTYDSDGYPKNAISTDIKTTFEYQ